MMSTVRKVRLKPEEYLAQERTAEFRSEYFDGETFAMAGASFHHTYIRDNMVASAKAQLRGEPCRIGSCDLRVKVQATGFYTYPDVVVFCDKPEMDDAVNQTLLNPRVIIEVLSDSTEKYDRGVKFDHYRKIPTLQEFVLVSQDRVLIERYVRQAETWILTVFDDADATFSFASIPVQTLIADVYENVAFDSNSTRVR